MQVRTNLLLKEKFLQITDGFQIKVPIRPGLGVNPDKTKWTLILAFD